MRGYLLGVSSVCGVIFFSVCLFLSNNLSIFWLFLELGSLALVPSFFLRCNTNVLEALFNYLVVSSVASSLIICGILFEGFLFLCFLGLLVKFGLFPFLGWVYKVFLGSNWVVVWGISIFLKMPFLFICFFLGAGHSYSTSVLCGLSFLILGLAFWYYTHSWLHCWSHMMLSSSAILIMMAVMGGSGDSLFYLFVVYALWGSFVIFFLSSLGDFSIGGVSDCFMFIFLLVSFPVSLSVFYKVCMGLCVYACSFGVFLAWCLYSVSEQLYLLSYLLSSKPIFETYGGIRLV